MYKRPLYILVLLIVILGGAIFFDTEAQNSSLYEGLPTVPCIDTTQKIVKQFTFNINIKINNQNNPLDPKIGHDYGQCLHEIYVDDSSGNVIVSENDNTPLNLGNFFDVWHKRFSQNQIFSYITDSTKSLKVYVNGKRELADPRLIPLSPNENIKIVYE